MILTAEIEKISALIDTMNMEVLGYLGVKLEKCEDHAIDHDATFMRIKRDYMGNDQECFVPFMKKINQTYGHSPRYPVADAYRTVNFKRDKEENLICPNSKRFFKGVFYCP